MNNQERINRIVYEVFVILWVITVLSFLCRIWPIILLTLIGIICVAIRLFVWKKIEISEISQEQMSQKKQSNDSDNDGFQTAYPLIVRQITDLVYASYPDAKWIWDTSKVREKIENGEELRILLNRAGGYRRATVRIVALCVKELNYQNLPDMQQADKTSECVEPKTITQEPLNENYELLAAEWVEAHIIELNSRCNQAIGQRQNCLLLCPEELPMRESWESIRDELIRAELENVECTEKGIQINFTQK